jgi:hypothetical protein
MTKRPFFTVTKESGRLVLPVTAACWWRGGVGFVSGALEGGAGRSALRRRDCGGVRPTRS